MNDTKIANFYANPDLDDGFGSTKGNRKNPHRGLDFPRGLGVPVPALGDGTVITQAYSTELGNVVEVAYDNGVFMGYRHMRTTGGPHVYVGQRVTRGDKIGEVSDTGNTAYGYHLCTTAAYTSGSVWGFPGRNVDPWPIILNMLAGDEGETIFETAPGGEPGAPNWPVGALMTRIQTALANRGRYDGLIDGIGGEKTAKGIQITLNVSETNGINEFVPTPVDGKLGINNAYGVQKYGKRFGDYTGDIDGDPLVNSWSSFALGLERP